jgi:regulation of enolase protein 1 (concanavalin A-like superfamily)
VRPNGGIEFMSRPSRGMPMSFVAGSASSLPVWLKLQRTGNTFTGYISADGMQWDAVGSTQVSLTNLLPVGLAVTSHDTTELNTATFDHVAATSDQLQDIDIGDTGAVGSVTTDDVTYTVRGSGADIWGTQDAFHFLYVTQVNDANFSANVERLDNTSPFAKAGIMIRASTDPSAAFVIVDVKPDGGIEFMARSINGGETQYIAGAAGSFSVPLSLRREGSTVSAYILDGYFGTKIGSIDIDLPPNALIGLVVTSHERGTLATATFSGVTR